MKIGATVRQLVPVIFERISGHDAEERQLREEPSPQFAQLVASILPKDTDPFVVDAYLMFQDIVVSTIEVCIVRSEYSLHWKLLIKFTRLFYDLFKLTNAHNDFSSSCRLSSPFG